MTAVAGVVTIYALGDMIVYNRKKKREYFAEQKAIAMAELHSAQEALARGTATEEQFAILIRENKLPNQASKASVSDSTDFGKAQAAMQQGAGKIAEESKGAWATAKSWIFAGLKKEEEIEDETARLGYEGTSEDDDVMGERSSDIARAVAARKIEMEQKAREALEREKKRQLEGGPLDRLHTSEEGQAGVRTAVADGAVGDAKPKGSGWSGFMGNR